MSEARSPREAVRNEVERLKNVIGWSWQMVGERLGMTSGQMFAFKALKSDLAAADLDWLRCLADAVAALPRPDTGVSAAAAVAHGEAGAMVSMHGAVAGGGQASDVATAALHGGTAVAVLADLYVGLADTNLTEEQREGAAWAIGQVAERQGLAQEVSERIGLLRAQAEEKASSSPRAQIGALASPVAMDRPQRERSPFPMEAAPF